METIKKLLSDILNIEFVQAVLSNPRKKEGILKVKVRPIEKKGNLFFQLESFTKTQAFHENLDPISARDRLLEYMEEFRQMQASTVHMNYTVLVSKKGKVTIQKKASKGSVRPVELSHNRSKKYILEEGIPVPFLQDLGVMTKDGKIVHSRFDKFRQINRFLEFIEDILPKLEKDREITILDFGCGKSYLTFAMYYYLHVLKEYDIRIIGLDLKSDVIHHCNELSRKYGYDKLEFLVGDIADYEGVREVDMVVTLHACDTATDYALYKAVKWHASVILSVPCCQHELNRKMQCETLFGAFQYGLIKERTAALMTDAMRGQLLEMKGYKTQLLEFIDMEHTPKNILIRGVKSRGLLPKAARKQQMENYQKCRDFFGAELTLEKLFKEMEGEMAYEQN